MIGTPGISNLVLFNENSKRADVMLVAITAHVLRLIRFGTADPSWDRKYGRASTQDLIVVLPLCGEHIYSSTYSVRTTLYFK